MANAAGRISQQNAWLAWRYSQLVVWPFLITAGLIAGVPDHLQAETPMAGLIL